MDQARQRPEIEQGARECDASDLHDAPAARTASLTSASIPSRRSLPTSSTTRTLRPRSDALRAGVNAPRTFTIRSARTRRPTCVTVSRRCERSHRWRSVFSTAETSQWLDLNPRPAMTVSGHNCACPVDRWPEMSAVNCPKGCVAIPPEAFRVFERPKPSRRIWRDESRARAVHRERTERVRRAEGPHPFAGSERDRVTSRQICGRRRDDGKVGYGRIAGRALARCNQIEQVQRESMEGVHCLCTYRDHKHQSAGEKMTLRLRVPHGVGPQLSGQSACPVRPERSVRVREGAKSKDASRVSPCFDFGLAKPRPSLSTNDETQTNALRGWAFGRAQGGVFY